MFMKTAWAKKVYRGLLLLGLMPFGTWVLLALASTLTTTGGLPALPPPPPAPAPAPYSVPGRLPIAAPQLLTPPAGASLGGPVWSFGWRPPAGAVPRNLLQRRSGYRGPTGRWLIG